MFVTGPTVSSVISPGLALSVSTMNSAAGCDSGSSSSKPRPQWNCRLYGACSNWSWGLPSRWVTSAVSRPT